MIVLRLARLYRRLREHRAIGFVAVLGMMAVCLVGNAICFLACEPGEAGHDLGDALWYSVISITTIGYGDLSATTLGSRLGTILFIVLLGLATFSVFLGMLIDWAGETISRGQRGMAGVIASGHVLIVNFPSEPRVRQIVDELQADPHYADREIVLVTDAIESNPIDARNLLFVRGHVLQDDTYERARVTEAEMAIVLATSYSDPNSDAVVASAASVINRHRPGLHVVAECLEPKHRALFDTAGCDALVFGMQVSANLLVQEAFDPGISQLVDVLTSNVRGTTLFSTAVPEGSATVAYNDLAKRLLDERVNLLCVNRDGESLTSFMDLESRAGDRIVYAATNRTDWSGLVGA